MTDIELLTHELTHRHAGNGYAAVEIIDKNWVRVTDKWCKKGQAFLAARDFLEIHQQAHKNSKGEWMDPAPVELTAEELAKLTPLRDGISSGVIKVVSTRFEKVSL